ncbi:MAG TPA: hypothetical protein VFL56_06600 [Solirubrobacterales bacterium]|nr:hypothetical protein [Solirubrobacterales bacterium]
MDANRLSQGQIIAAVSAIALFIISFLPWFGFSPDVAVQGVEVGGDENFNLWQSQNPFDVYLLIVILVALVPPALTLLGGAEDSAPLAPIATALLAGVGTLLILYQVFETPGELDRKVGLFLGLIACGGIAVGGYLMMQEDAGRERY